MILKKRVAILASTTFGTPRTGFVGPSPRRSRICSGPSLPKALNYLTMPTLGPLGRIATTGESEQLLVDLPSDPAQENRSSLAPTELRDAPLSS